MNHTRLIVEKVPVDDAPRFVRSVRHVLPQRLPNLEVRYISDCFPGFLESIPHPSAQLWRSERRSYSRVILSHGHKMGPDDDGKHRLAVRGCR